MWSGRTVCLGASVKPEPRCSGETWMAASSLSTRTPPGRLFQAADHFVFASGYSFSPVRYVIVIRAVLSVLWSIVSLLVHSGLLLLNRLSSLSHLAYIFLKKSITKNWLIHHNKMILSFDLRYYTWVGFFRAFSFQAYVIAAGCHMGGLIWKKMSLENINVKICGIRLSPTEP